MKLEAPRGSLVLFTGDHSDVEALYFELRKVTYSALIIAIGVRNQYNWAVI